MNTRILIFFTLAISSHCFFYETTKLLKVPLTLQIDTILNKSNLSKTCLQDLKRLKQDSFKLEPWALTMLDASAKPTSGILEGAINLIGSFEQCLSIRHNLTIRTIQGQYCTAIVSINIDLNSPEAQLIKKILTNWKDIIGLDIHELTEGFPIGLGLCVPQSCQVADLNRVAATVTRSLKLPANFHFKEFLCQYSTKPKDIKALDICIYAFFGAVACLMLASTLYDLYLRITNQKPTILVVYSVVRNLQKLLQPEAPNPRSITCLNGLKFVCCLWVIAAHLLQMQIFFSKNLAVFDEWRRHVISTYIWSAFYAVTTFFTISGFLTTYSYLRITEKCRVDLLSFYGVRLVRLTPALLATVFLHTSWMKLFATGPFGEAFISVMTKTCQRRWWSFLFYFYQMGDKKCMVHDWYLTLDSYFYAGAPLILFFIRKYPKRVLIGITGAIVSATCYNFLITIEKQLGFTIFQFDARFIHYLYFASAYHLPVWLIGVLLCYILYFKTARVSFGLNVFLWIISLYTLNKLITDQLDYVSSDYNVYKAAYWNAFSGPLWALALSFTIYSCATGSGGFINYFFSLDIFRIFGKLTYCMYLIHPCVIMIMQTSRLETSYFTLGLYISNIFHTFFFVVLGAILLFLGFEAPIIAMKDFYHVETKKIKFR